MFYRIFNKTKYRSAVRIITLILLTGFIITINGCTTTSSVRYPKELLIQENSTTDISYIILKDGKKILTKNKKIIYADSIKSLIIMNYDTLVAGKKIKLVESNKPGAYDTIKSENIKSAKPSGKNKVIPVNDVLEFFEEKTETDGGLTTLFIIGVIGGVALATILIKNATERDQPQAPPLPPPRPPDTTTGGGGSCPLVYSFDGEKYVFDSEPITGVISESLTRTDYSGMEFLKQSEGKFKLLVKNQPEEKEMLDELKLVCVPHEENTFVTPNPEGEFFKYKKIIKPESVRDENGNDVRVFFDQKDNVRWQTLMPFDTSFRGGPERHSLKFRFPKPDGADNALLLVNCGTAYWGSSMIKKVLQLKGEKVDDWYGNMLTGGKEMQKLFKFIQREELFWLNVDLLEGDKYVTRTYIPAGGPMMDEDRIIRLPLKNVTGNYVEFVINPPAGFWKIDQIGIIYDYDIIGKEKIKQLDAVYAKDQDGEDISSEIESIDKNYYQMPGYGNQANIFYDVPANFDENRNEIFLKTTGYYEIYIDKGKVEQTELLNEIMNTPGKIIEYSMMLYNQKIKSISEYLNVSSKKKN